MEPEDVVYQRIGDKYKPIGAAIRKECLPEGHWHLHVKPNELGISLLSKSITPDYFSLHAALKEWMDVVVDEMYDACKIRINKRMPDEVAQAYSAMCESLGDDIPVYFEYETIERIVQTGLMKIEELCESEG
jgi:hypothetical protein